MDDYEMDSETEMFLRIFYWYSCINFYVCNFNYIVDETFDIAEFYWNCNREYWKKHKVYLQNEGC